MISFFDKISKEGIFFVMSSTKKIIIEILLLILFILIIFVINCRDIIYLCLLCLNLFLLGIFSLICLVQNNNDGSEQKYICITRKEYDTINNQLLVDEEIIKEKNKRIKELKYIINKNKN